MGDRSWSNRAAFGGEGAICAVVTGVRAVASLLALGAASPALAQSNTINNATVIVPSLAQPSPWTMTGSLTVASTGNAVLDIVSGGVVNNLSGTIAANAGSTGMVSVSGAGSTWNNSNGAAGSLRVGVGGAGTLTVDLGGQVVSGSGAVGTLVTGTGDVTVTGAGSLWQVAGDLSIARQGQGSVSILDGGRITSNFGNFGFGGVGSLLIDGANSAWIITNNLTMGGNGSGGVSVPGSGSIEIRNAGRLQIASANLGQAVGGSGSITVSGEGSRWDANGNLLVGGSGSGTLRVEQGGDVASTVGRVADGAGSTGSATITGAGSTWTMSSQLGVGRLGTGSLAITDGATVSAAAALVGAEVSGRGSVTVSGPGSTWTSSGLLYLGQFGIGSLLVGQGGAVNSATGVLGLNAGSTGSAVITGAGSLWTSTGAMTVGINGSGTMDIAGGGALTSSRGAIGDGATGSGTVTVTGSGSRWTSAGALTIANAGSGTLSILDSAMVTSAGGSIGAQAGSSGVVTLASGGSWASSAAVTVGGAGAGTLNIGAASGQPAAARGSVTAPSVALGTSGRIVFNHTDVSGTYTFAAPMSGTGSVRHESGFTVLTGVSTYSGATTVTGGTLAVDGAIGSSAVTVSGPGFLIGNGTAGSLTAASGGTVAPGRSIGTLNVSGNVSFAPGSIFDVEIEASGTGDLIQATGTATLSGGTVVLKPEPGTYGVQTYTILSAAGGVTGVFDALDTPEFAFVTPRLDYTSTTVDLVFDPTVPIETLGVTPNQKATAQGVASLGGGNPVFDAVLFSPTTADALMALDALSGEVHASATSAGMEDARWVREAVLDRLRWGARGGAPGTGVWAQGLGAWGDLDSDGNAAAMTTTSEGFIIGADAVRDGALRLGVAGGMTKTSFDIDDRRSSGDTTSGFGAIYGGAAMGALTVRGGVSAGVRSIDTERDVIFTGFADRAEASYEGYSVQGFGEAGYEMAFGATTLEPFAGLSLVRVGVDSFVEDGGDAALEGDAMAHDLATSILALRGSVALNGAGDAAPVARGLVGWLHAFGDLSPEADLAFATGSTGFTVWGVPVAEDALAAQAAFDWALNGSFTAGVEYSGQIAADVQSHAVKANVAVAF